MVTNNHRSLIETVEILSNPDRQIEESQKDIKNG